MVRNGFCPSTVFFLVGFTGVFHPYWICFSSGTLSPRDICAFVPGRGGKNNKKQWKTPRPESSGDRSARAGRRREELCKELRVDLAGVPGRRLRTRGEGAGVAGG